MKKSLILLILAFAPPSRADTVIQVDDAVLRAGLGRFGIGLAQHNYYDSNQMMKELLFRNPGFEGLLYQSVVRLGPGGTANSAIEDQPFTQWPSSFWAGASYEIIWSSGGTRGRSGTVSTSRAPNRANPPNDPGGSSQGTTYVFADSDAGRIPLEGDYMVLRKTETGGMGGGAAFASWQVNSGGGGTVTSELSDLPPGTIGRQCARLEAATSGQQAGVTGQFDTLTGFVRLNGSFRLAFKAKGIGGANRLFVSVRRGALTACLSQTVQLSGEWADYSLPFTVHEDLATSGTVSVSLSATGQSSALIDDVSLRQTDGRADNPTEFRDDVVDALAGLRPGILRYVNWQQVGDSLANALTPVFGRRRSGYSVYSTTENNMMPGLHEFLVLCEHLGANPWYCMPVPFSTQEAADLMEYLGGPASTPYGALRAARGHPIPWTSVFSRIHLEFGNENWNNSAYRGAAITVPLACGNRATEIFSIIKTSPYYQAARFQCVLGGQNGNHGLNLALHNACSGHDAFTLAPYMAYRVDNDAGNEELFGPLFAEPEWWSFNPGATSGLMRYALNQLQSSSRPVPLSVYEVNLHTTTGAISQSALDSLTPSVGAAIAVADHMLVMLKELDSREQVFFSLAGHSYSLGDGRTARLWGSVLDMGRTNRKRPHYHALQMVNDLLSGDLVRTTHSGDDPTWSVTNMNRVTYAGAHHLQSFAFSDNTQRGLILFNLHRTSALDVRFSGINAPSGTVTMRRLTSASITDNNESAEVVAPVTQTLPGFNPGQAFSLPPFSMTLLQWTAPGIQAWRFQHFGTVVGSGSAADDADPDGDGLVNLLEYATGTSPLLASAMPWSVDPDSGHLQVSLTKNPAAVGLAWSAETSEDLVSWQTGQVSVHTDDATTFSVRDTADIGASPKRFLRLRVTVAP